MANTEQALKISEALIYTLTDGVNHSEIRVTMANGSHSDEACHALAKRVFSLLTAASAEVVQPGAWTDLHKELGKKCLAELSAAPQASQPIGQPDEYNGEEWELLAMALAEEEHDDIHQLIWTGGPIPEPWGEVWQQYEEGAKKMIELVRKHVPNASNSQPVSGAELTDEFLRKMWTKAGKDGGVAWGRDESAANRHTWQLRCFSKLILSASGQASQSEKAVRDAALRDAYRAAENVLPYKDEKQRNPVIVRNEILNAIYSLASTPAQQTEAQQGEKDTARLDFLEQFHRLRANEGHSKAYGDVGTCLISRTSDGWMLDAELNRDQPEFDTLREAIDAASAIAKDQAKS